jgi:hypothetical protein
MMSGDPYTIRVPVIIEVTGSGRDEDDLTARLTAALNATEDLDYPLRAGEFFIRTIEPDSGSCRPWTFTSSRPS